MTAGRESSLTVVPGGDGDGGRGGEVADGEGGIVLEHGVPLARSLLWRLQRDYFEREGIGAWQKGIVPHYITTNPFIADAFARVFVAWLRDVGPLDEDEPVHVIELGAGSGRFGFHFLASLAEQLGGRPRVRYVLTDLAERTVAWWRDHPALAPHLAAGRLDVARFDAEHDDSLELAISGTRLAAGRLRNPVAVVANYFFDSIPHDAFLLEEGRLYAGLTSLSLPAADAGRPLDADLLDRLRLAYEFRPTTAHHYGDPDVDAVLREYQERLGRTHLRFPIAAMRCLARLRRIAGDRLLVLSADKGFVDEAALVGLDPPRPVFHGSFSLSVDYHALGLLARRAGGAFLGAGGDSSLVTAALLFGRPAGGWPLTERAFADAIGGFGPLEFHVVKQVLDDAADRLTIAQAIAFLRLGRHDARTLAQVLPALTRLGPSATAGERLAVREEIERVWARYLPLGEALDLAFHIGVLLVQLGVPTDAGRYFERSLAAHGRDPSTLYNLALCHRAVGRPADALVLVEEALTHNPAHDGLRTLRLELLRETLPG